MGARSKFWGVLGWEDWGGGDNSIQFINIGRVGDGDFFILLARQNRPL